MKPLTVKTFVHKSISKRVLKSLQYPSGLFAASKKDVSTGYNAAWIRDNIYEAMGLERLGEMGPVLKSLHALLDILLKHEYKIDWAIREKPDAPFKYIHARYCPHSLQEFPGEWGNMQNDAIGALLFWVGKLQKKKKSVLRDEQDARILQKLILYLSSIEYWQDKDNGIWENEEEVHASSIGACVAGLKAVRGQFYVPQKLVEKGEEALQMLLPRESASKEVDLALLTLIYPYNIISVQHRSQILKNIEERLVRERGLIRYFGDPYYQKDGKEAEWTMGFAWLAKIYKDLGNEEKYLAYLEKLHKIMNWKGELPELYFGGTSQPNKNTPLGWSHAMYLVAVT